MKKVFTLALSSIYAGRASFIQVEPDANTSRNNEVIYNMSNSEWIAQERPSMLTVTIESR